MTLDTRSHQRLYTRERMDEARLAWRVDDYGSEWRHLQRLAAVEGGIIDPPNGTRWDGFHADPPSHRATVVQTLRDDPDTLLAALRAPGPPSWSKVIAIIVGVREERRERAHRDEMIDRRIRAQEPSRREAAEIVDSLFGGTREWPR